MLLVEEDRRSFASRTVEEMNDEGDLVTRKIPGWEVLLRKMDVIEEAKPLGEAIIKCIGLSQALVSEAQSKEKKTPIKTSSKSQKSAGAK